MTEIFLFKSNQCINSFNYAIDNVKREVDSLNNTCVLVEESVNASFDDLKAKLDERRLELLRNLTRIKGIYQSRKCHSHHYTESYI